MKSFILIFTLFISSISLSQNVDKLGIEGVQLFETGNIQGALLKFEAIMEIDDSIVEAHIRKADCLGLLKKHELSIKSYSNAIELNPQSKLAYYNRAVAFENIYEYYKAEKDYLSALETDPKNTTDIGNDLIYNNLGIIYGLQDNLDKAIDAFRNATTINNQYAEAYFNKGLVLEKKGLNKVALKEYSKAHEIDPSKQEYLVAKLRVNLF